jgi:D-alanine-D-alanine ligase
MKQRIALVTGGYSGESVISYKSAATIFEHLDKEKFEVYVVDINPEGWFYVKEGERVATVDKNDFSLVQDSKQIKFDAVFIGMHGTPGEDGKLQGYFDMLRLPYTSCNAATSALTFNKRYTVAVAALAGIPVAPSVHLFAHTPYAAADILTQLKLPLFVKPNNGGSSIGMSKVKEAGELEAAITKAFGEDEQVLVEQMISGREFTVGVFKMGGAIKVLPITEVVAKNDFFDYEAKYHGASTEITPAQLPEDWQQQIEASAKNIYAVCNCSGVVRIDFIYDEAAGKPYMLEINTVPGQSEASIIPQQVRAMGWSLQEFYTSLLQDALAKR